MATKGEAKKAKPEASGLKLDPKTLGVLENFVDINMSIIIKPGDKLRTISPAKNVIAVATVPTEFPAECAIYDLKQLLGAIKAVEDPRLEFGDKSLTIGNGRSTVRFTYSAPENVIAPADADPKLPSVDAEFTIDNKSMRSAINMVGVLGLIEVALVGRGGKAYLAAINSKDKSAHRFEVEIGKTDDDFELIFRAEALKFMPGDYKVQVSQKGYARFEGDGVTYWIAIEKNSTYGDLKGSE